MQSVSVERDGRCVCSVVSLTVCSTRGGFFSFIRGVRYIFFSFPSHLHVVEGDEPRHSGAFLLFLWEGRNAVEWKPIKV